jgi:endo-1,4-beta-xylanase
MRDFLVPRRSLLLGAAGAAGLTAAGGLSGPASATEGRTPLWKVARKRGIAYGSSIATWQFDDEYPALFAREAKVLFTEDDLLWYRLKPAPDAPLDFSYADRIIGFAEANRMRVFGAHLVWDEGFGEGWPEDYLWSIDEAEARELLFGTLTATVRGVRGFRTDVPWWETIGPSYVTEAFHLAHAADPGALLVINEFGFETVNEWGDEPEPRRRATLQVIDRLLRDGAPVHALGVQAHLLADRFAERFDARAYARWLDRVADRGLDILITELDVLDDGLPADVGPRDAAVADVYRRYLDVALDHRAVKVVLSFGLTDRYTWLQEDQPREDGAARRPLPFDEDLRPKPAYRALAHALACAPDRRPLWTLPA